MSLPVLKRPRILRKRRLTASLLPTKIPPSYFANLGILGSSMVSTNLRPLLPPSCFVTSYTLDLGGPPVTPPPLILKGCKIDVSIIDVHSRVTLSQEFHNQTDFAANRVTYTFSVLSSAAICDFEMIRQDGTKVTGVVKEKEQARRELDVALAVGHTAALGEEQTKDLFSICVGNVLPQETITINLTYIHTLTDDESLNQVRFTLPRAYMQRYGQAPTHNIFNSIAHEDVPFTMDVFVQQAGRIRSVSSPSGLSIAVNHGRPAHVDASVGPDANFATLSVRRTDVSSPSKDVILVITADELDKPRAFIEPHPSPDHQTDAIGLTLVPRFKPIESPHGMEYIFVVDRSGSMRGVKMQMTRAALTVLLKGLPSKGTLFNIFSFGSTVTSLWSNSRVYDQNTVDMAMNHINEMTANYGGTEIARAIDAVYQSLPARLSKPVSIFLLTDGGAWDVEDCMSKTKTAIHNRASDSMFMRVFTVGMGNGVSTETCDGIARAGGGTSVYIINSEEQYIGKCARLVSAARMAPIVNVEVTWQAPQPQRERSVTPGETINLFEPDIEHETSDLGPLAGIRQAPSIIPSLFPSTRLQIFAIVPRDTTTRESVIKISGFVPATSTPVEVRVPVQSMTRPLGTAFMHTCAAKVLIAELEESGEPDAQKTAIIRLGTTYGLTSRFTSFIAVDNSQGPPVPVDAATRGNQASIAPGFPAYAAAYQMRAPGTALNAGPSRPREPNHPHEPIHELPKKRARHASRPPASSAALPPPPRVVPPRPRPMASPAPAPQSPPPSAGLSHMLFGAPLASPSPWRPESGREREREAFVPPPQQQPFTMSAPRRPVGMLQLQSQSSTATRTALLSAIQGSGTRLSHTYDAPPAHRLMGDEWTEDNGKDNKMVDTKEEVLLTLARLQLFDGGFGSNSASVIDLLNNLGGDTAQVVLQKYGLGDEVAAAFLAWAWMSLCCGVEADGMKEKADLWLQGSVQGIDVDAVQHELLSVIAFRPL
ncbi:hypothetical protein BV22DRAFT_1041703 [Leucogyrophana mollusca]|uniref:Uncharacterized protein n=1 Tax=Leucogyrophana mollusca TaxID=85980 RepID=A0ACB8AYP3_9AGAM|nr:hypothetical protein BV22DRAFT_1041703 [Leucogyrophana mollusca]